MDAHPLPALYTRDPQGLVGPGQQKKNSNTPLMRVWLQSEKETVCLCVFMDINTSGSSEVKHKGNSLRHKRVPPTFVFTQQVEVTQQNIQFDD